jgi:hypothetical protein
MFGIFKKTSEADKLRKKHARILKEAYQLSHTNRKESDAKYAEADKLAREIESLSAKE